jgi:hypothetical protein
MKKIKKTIAYQFLSHLNKTIKFLLAPIRQPLKNFYYQKLKYSNNFYSNSFDWDWKKTNYNRIALVNLLISKQKKNCAYLEIGCASNSLFDSVFSTDKTGVDPISGGNVRKTSDEFFKNNKKSYDVIFIDGLHSYGQVRKDIINAIKCLNNNGWIALHDMLPRNWIECNIPDISPNAWTGDVWKVAFELSQTEDIDFRIITIDHGVGLFRIIKKKPFLIDLQSELREKKFSYFYQQHNKLPILDWRSAQAWVSNYHGNL